MIWYHLEIQDWFYIDSFHMVLFFFVLGCCCTFCKNCSENRKILKPMVLV
jgi:hypothetical protein